MRPVQLVIAGFVGSCVVLLLLLATRHECVVPIADPPTTGRPVRIVDSACWSCGSGSGPSAESLAALVELADDETVVAIDEQETSPTRRAALPEAIDARDGRQRSHRQFMDFEIASTRGQRRVLVLLH